MTPEHSKILVNDLIIADLDRNMYGPRMDINMMVMLGALERTESQWRKLIGEAGLHVDKIWKESEENLSVIEISLSKGEEHAVNGS